MQTHRVPAGAMLRAGLLALTLGISGALAACGGDSGDDSTAADTTTAGADASGSCAESFASSADETLTGIVELSHSPDGEIVAGTYTGEAFEAETYDEQVDGDGTETSVEPGDCVLTEVSPDFGPLYLFVEGADGWHRLLESDPKVPLVPDPEAQLENVEQVQFEAITG